MRELVLARQALAVPGLAGEDPLLRPGAEADIAAYLSGHIRDDCRRVVQHRPSASRLHNVSAITHHQRLMPLMPPARASPPVNMEGPAIAHHRGLRGPF
ncbi:MAG: hypothetical protein ACP5VP_12015, partial [Candidatus Limnocylindrales bacterium]